ncbi:MAG: hypothetical protein GTO02_20985 [Candidatus Dadabacteria bacterium]|nr:hypothetical protein [Candidatus Dadabacteria bacterium]
MHSDTVFAKIYNKRLLHLLVIFNLFLCTTGLYSATDLIAKQPTRSICHDHTEVSLHNSLEHDSNDLEINATNTECYDCCLDVLPVSSELNNFNSTTIVVNYLPYPQSESEYSSGQHQYSVSTNRPHGPPDLYILNSSYLL